MSETNGVAEWLYTTLKAGTALCSYIGGTTSPRIYEDFAPGTATRPFVTFNLISSFDEVAVGASRQVTDQEWAVLAGAQAQTYNSVKSISDAVDTLLHAQQGSATINGVYCKCVRTQEIRYTTVEEGKVWKYMGGYYHIFAGST